MTTLNYWWYQDFPALETAKGLSWIRTSAQTATTNDDWQWMAENGWAVIYPMIKNFGRSGNYPSYSTSLTDIHRVADACAATTPPIPLYIGLQSMIGGGTGSSYGNGSINPGTLPGDPVGDHIDGLTNTYEYMYGPWLDIVNSTFTIAGYQWEEGYRNGVQWITDRCKYHYQPLYGGTATRTGDSTVSSSSYEMRTIQSLATNNWYSFTGWVSGATSFGTTSWGPEEMGFIPDSANPPTTTTGAITGGSTTTVAVNSMAAPLVVGTPIRINGSVSSNEVRIVGASSKTSITVTYRFSQNYDSSATITPLVFSQSGFSRANLVSEINAETFQTTSSQVASWAYDAMLRTPQYVISVTNPPAYTLYTSLEDDPQSWNFFPFSVKAWYLADTSGYNSAGNTQLAYTPLVETNDTGSAPHNPPNGATMLLMDHNGLSEQVTLTSTPSNGLVSCSGGGLVNTYTEANEAYMVELSPFNTSSYDSTTIPSVPSALPGAFNRCISYFSDPTTGIQALTGVKYQGVMVQLHLHDGGLTFKDYAEYMNRLLLLLPTLLEVRVHGGVVKPSMYVRLNGRMEQND